MANIANRFPSVHRACALRLPGRQWSVWRGGLAVPFNVPRRSRRPIDAATLIPHMLEAFMARDRGFRKSRGEWFTATPHKHNRNTPMHALMLRGDGIIAIRYVTAAARKRTGQRCAENNCETYPISTRKLELIR